MLKQEKLFTKHNVFILHTVFVKYIIRCSLIFDAQLIKKPTQNKYIYKKNVTYFSYANTCSSLVFFYKRSLYLEVTRCLQDMLFYT